MNQIRKIFNNISPTVAVLALIYVSVFALTVALFIFSNHPRPIQNYYVRPDPFLNLEVRAKAAYVYDSKENKVLFEKNARESLPLASITKLMTVHCSLKDQKTNHFLTVPDKVYSYNDHATSTGQSELWRINDLATYTLITSSNAGAVTLASNIGGEDAAVVCMNKEAGAMNLFETSFTNVTGLDIDDATAGAVGSAENVVTMLQKIYLDHEDIISKTAYDSYEIRAGNGTIHQALNTNIVAPNIVGFLASKTGLTDIAGGNITFVMDAGLDHKVFVAILGSTEADRFNDALALSDAIIKSFLK